MKYGVADGGVYPRRRRVRAPPSWLPHLVDQSEDVDFLVSASGGFFDPARNLRGRLGANLVVDAAKYLDEARRAVLCLQVDANVGRLRRVDADEKADWRRGPY